MDLSQEPVPYCWLVGNELGPYIYIHIFCDPYISIHIFIHFYITFKGLNRVPQTPIPCEPTVSCSLVVILLSGGRLQSLVHRLKPRSPALVRTLGTSRALGVLVGLGFRVQGSGFRVKGFRV